MLFSKMNMLTSLALLTLSGHVTAAIYNAPDPEPSAEETLILELVNRMRADPVAERDILAPEGTRPQGVPGNVDLKMFRDEMGKLKPKPPLVFNLDLLKAARWHSYYMIHNGIGHVEEKGKEGFTGVSFGDRCKAAGYSGAKGENAFRDARDPAYSHLGFVIDWGKGGPGGMQPGRGHRGNIMGDSRELGPGAVPHSGRLSITHNFGNRRSVPRFAGGVTYVDRNRNDFYDIGEGVGGVTIQASGVKTDIKTWKSGAYTLELSHTDAVAIKATWNGLEFQQEFAAGSDSIHFNWQIPPAAELERADQLIAEVKSYPIDSSSKSDQKKRFIAALDLYLASKTLSLDEPRRQEIAALTESVAAELEAQQKLVRDAFDAEPKDFKKLLKDAGKIYKKTAAEQWFKEAALYKEAKFLVSNFERLKDEAKPEVIKKLEMAQEQAETREFTAAFGDLIKEARSKG